MVGDICDTGDDKDGDGVQNDVDNCPDTANADQLDIDEDGIGKSEPSGPILVLCMTWLGPNNISVP